MAVSPRPTDAPLPDDYFSGGSRLTDGGLLRFLSELEDRVNDLVLEDPDLSAPTHLVYLPGGTASSGVYVTFASLMAAFQAVNSQAQIIMDDSFESPIVLPAKAGGGDWTVPHDMIWRGRHIGVPTVVHLEDGFRVAGPSGQIGVSLITDDLEIHVLADSGGANVVPFHPTVDDALILQYGAKVQCDGDLPLLRTAGAVDPIQIIVGCYVAPEIRTGSTQAFEADGTDSVVAFCLTFATIQDDVFSGSGTTLVYNGLVNPNLSQTQPQVAADGGTFTYVSLTELHACGYTPAVPGNFLVAPANAGAAVDELAYRANPLFIVGPSAAINADFEGADLVDAVTEVAPTATRKFDPRTAPIGLPAGASYAFTLWKSNAAAFGVTIDVTTGGNAGWTTDSGLNTDHPIVGSDAAAPGQWLVRVDTPNKRVNVLPVA